MRNFEELLAKEGFKYIYMWTDEPHVKYPKHAHKGKVSFYISEGSLTVKFEDGKHVVLKKGDYFTVPIGVKHTAEIGSSGCTFIVGEEIKGDS